MFTAYPCPLRPFLFNTVRSFLPINTYPYASSSVRARRNALTDTFILTSVLFGRRVTPRNRPRLYANRQTAAPIPSRRVPVVRRRPTTANEKTEPNLTGDDRRSLSAGRQAASLSPGTHVGFRRHRIFEYSHYTPSRRYAIFILHLFFPILKAIIYDFINFEKFVRVFITRVCETHLFSLFALFLSHRQSHKSYRKIHYGK